MTKEEIESILLINLYFTKCKILKPFSPITELVRSYLCNKINKALNYRKDKGSLSKTERTVYF